MEKFTCLYCVQWRKSTVIKRHEKNGITKYCIIKNKNIRSDKTQCKYFEPCDNFYCFELEQVIPPIVCKNRKKLIKENKKKYGLLYQQCKKCRQYEFIIKPLCKEYNLSENTIKIRRKEYKKKEFKIKRKFVLKRKNKPFILKRKNK